MTSTISSNAMLSTPAASVTNATSSVYYEGSRLFRMGDRLDRIYIVNSGVVKLFTVTESGEEHIVRFCMPGDLLGLEAFSGGISQTDAMILDIANVSAVPLSTILQVNSEIDLAELMERIAKTLAKETEHCLMISQATAARRLAWFLSEFAEKLAGRGLVSNAFDMPMTRSEIGLYLGLAVETVSRELAKFCKKGILYKNLKHIEILDMDALHAVAKSSSALH